MQSTLRQDPKAGAASMPALLCSKEVMSFLNIVSRHTLRLMVARGQFPQPIRVNARFQRWRREDVQRWYEEANASEPDPQTATSVG